MTLRHAAVTMPSEQPISALDAAREYLRRGWLPIPIPHGAKALLIANWPELRIGEADLPRYFSDGENVGVVLTRTSEHPIRRTLALIARNDGAVRVMYTASRGDCATKRESWGLARTDAEMAAILAGHPVVSELDFVLPRIQSGKRRVSLLKNRNANVNFVTTECVTTATEAKFNLFSASVCSSVNASRCQSSR